MGMYDCVKCLYPTPWPDTKDVEWQTKDTEAQYLDTYEIREDGTLWHEEYETEDRSDPNAVGWRAVIGCMTRINSRWVQQTDFTGQLEIKGSGYRIIFWFRDGKVKDVVFYENDIEIDTKGKEEGEPQ